MTTSKTVWSLILGAALTTAACGDSKSSMNPVAPTSVVADGVVHDESGGAVSTATGKGGNGKGGGNSNSGPGNGNSGGDNGKGNGNGNSGPGNGNGTGRDQPTTPAVPPPPSNTTPPAPPTNTTPSTTFKVEIEGVISAKGTAQITVDKTVIDVPSSAVIRHGSRRFTLADLHVGDRVHVKGERTTTGAGTTAVTRVEATEVNLQNAGDDDEREDDDSSSSISSAVRPKG